MFGALIGLTSAPASSSASAVQSYVVTNLYHSILMQMSAANSAAVAPNLYMSFGLLGDPPNTAATSFTPFGFGGNAGYYTKSEHLNGVQNANAACNAISYNTRWMALYKIAFAAAKRCIGGALHL